MILKLLTILCFVESYYFLPQSTNLDELISSVFNPTEAGNNNNNPKLPPNTVIDKPNVGIPNIGPNNGISNSCEFGSDCVPFYLCKDDNSVNTIGEGILDIRIDADDGSPPKQCPSYMETCCAVEKKTTEPIYKPPPIPEGCGYRNVDGIGFKITGDKDNETQYGEFPWMVAVLKEEIAQDQIFNIYQCGGSLIHPSVVLTASHCVDKKLPTELKVRAGEWDTKTKDEIFPDQDRDVVDIVMHPQYHKGGLFNDIALLFLSNPFDLAENVKPICLPPTDMNFDYTRCFATGWGKDNFGQAGKYQVILKKIDLPIVPHDQCESLLRTTRLGKYYQLHDSFICAGGEIGKDTCKGDGGSPLVCPIPNSNNRYYQTGIVAWGIGCGDAIPGVYASVPKLRYWIDGVLAERKIEHKYYTP